jgi:hypothetical protein
VGKRSSVESLDPEFADSPNDTGGMDYTLRPMEALDSDDVRNDGDDEVDRIDPQDHGRDKGQIDGSPEDGPSMFPVVE